MKTRVSLVIFSLIAATLFWGCASEQITSARLYIREQNWAKAEEQLLIAAQSEPENAEVHVTLGVEIYGRRGDWAAMNAAFDRAMAVGADKTLPTGTKVSAVVENTRMQHWSEHYNKGADVYNQAVLQQGDGRREKLTEAAAAFEVARQILPSDAKAYKNLVFCYLQMDARDKARALIDEALAHAPDDPDLVSVAGRVMKEGGETDRAIELLKKAMELNPTNPSVIRSLADIYHTKGDTAAAINLYQQAIAIAPDNSDLIFNLGVLLLQTGKYAEAESRLSQVLALNPDDSEAIQGVAEAYERLGRWTDAEQYYRKALVAEPKNAVMMRALARVVYQQGRRDEAAKLLEEAKKLN